MRSPGKHSRRRPAHAARGDGQTIVDWPADYRRCRTYRESPDRHRLGLTTHLGVYQFTAVEIRPPGDLPPQPAEKGARKTSTTEATEKTTK
jgi:hypothetical protein